MVKFIMNSNGSVEMGSLIKKDGADDLRSSYNNMINNHTHYTNNSKDLNLLNHNASIDSGYLYMSSDKSVLLYKHYESTVTIQKQDLTVSYPHIYFLYVSSRRERVASIYPFIINTAGNAVQPFTNIYGSGSTCVPYRFDNNSINGQLSTPYKLHYKSHMIKIAEALNIDIYRLGAACEGTMPFSSSNLHHNNYNLVAYAGTYLASPINNDLRMRCRTRSQREHISINDFLNKLRSLQPLQQVDFLKSLQYAKH